MNNTTKQRIQNLIDRANELASIFNVPMDRAWVILASSEAQKALEVAEMIDARQRKIEQAEKRAKAAYAATFKSNVEVDQE